MDPTKYKDDKELAYAYTIAHGAAKSAEEILNLVEEAQDDVEELIKKERGEENNTYAIGSKGNTTQGKGDKEIV